MRSPVIWYGGKGQLAPRLLPLLPPHTVYVEPFAGGASLLFAKRPAPLEVLNDVHGALVTLYRVLRDPSLFERFQLLCQLTPYSRDEFESCRDAWATRDDPAEQAWAFFVAVRQSFAGHVSPSTSPTWAFSIANPESNAASKWLSAVDGLADVHQRLRRVQIEHRDFRRVLEMFDGPDVLWYVDPPYVLSSRDGGSRYDHEMTDEDHRDLVRRLLDVQGMVVLSGYRVAHVHDALEVAGWQRSDIDVPVAAARQQAQMRRIESVWRNPAAIAAWERHRGPLFALAGGEA